MLKVLLTDKESTKAWSDAWSKAKDEGVSIRIRERTALDADHKAQCLKLLDKLDKQMVLIHTCITDDDIDDCIICKLRLYLTVTKVDVKDGR